MVRKRLTGLPRFHKKLLLLGSDLALLWLSLLLAYIVRLGSTADIDPFSTHLAIFFLAPATSVLACRQLGLYRTVTRFTGIEILGTITRSMLVGLAVFFIVLFLLPNHASIPRSVPMIYLSFGIFSLTMSRYLAGLWLHGNSLSFLANHLIGNTKTTHRGSPIAIYGAGAAGRQVSGAISKGHKYHAVAYIDDDITKHGIHIAGLNVFAPSDISKLIQELNIEKVLLAMPSSSNRQRKNIIDQLAQYDLHIITMPGLDEVAEGLVSLEEVREVSVEEILGRTPVEPNQALLEPHIKNKNVLVTGAGGSIGSELCRQIIKQQPTTLVLFENSEVSLYRIHTELESICINTASPTIIYPVLGTVKKPSSIQPVINKFAIHTLYHAAAYKHVPMVEFNSYSGFANNTLGTAYAAQAAILEGVEKFVLISTDKAVRPTNFMGATKRMAELVLQALSHENTLQLIDPDRFNLPSTTTIINNTKFTMVRFGNVLDSSGSVVPKFRQQIAENGPITVTHPDIIRYFMTIPEAAQLVIQAGTMGNQGDVFLLDMGEPVKIADLARKMIKLYGLQVRDEENPNGDIEIQYSGLRPGEKLYEELLIGNNADTTSHIQIFKANETQLSWAQLNLLLEQIRTAFQDQNYQEVRDIMVNTQELGYQPSDNISDWFHTTNHNRKTEIASTLAPTTAA
mgnify:CR=1 FL=1